jgi:hypothetical protein
MAIRNNATIWEPKGMLIKTGVGANKLLAERHLLGGLTSDLRRGMPRLYV